MMALCLHTDTDTENAARGAALDVLISSSPLLTQRY